MVTDFQSLVERIREEHADEIAHARAAGLGGSVPEFDPIAWRVEQCEGVLDRRVPAKFRGCGIEREELTRWVDGLVTDPQSIPPLVLIGKRGTGKTGNAWAALMVCALRYARSGRTLIWEAWMHADFNAAILPKPDDSHMAVIERCMRAGLLLLDDLASARIKDWWAEALLRVVDHRLTHQLPTMFTTNTTRDELDEAVGPRLASRLRDTARLGFWGDDRRGGAL